jgi:L-seryl-tRNA(Ser) seleniumtransferase
MREIACGYSNLEFDINANKRSKRGTMVGRILAAYCGAEAGMMVNNNASSVYMIVANLGSGRDVVISRGQLIQIGGGFRIPDIIERSGANLKEIGTTNKTTISDYNKAINKSTALILIVHKSNFIQRGFTEEPEPSKIVELAKKKKVPVCFDLGSGLPVLDDLSLPESEPDIVTAVRTGADVVCFSGDKLLGGPQAGLIVGSC